jgi:hypothetical protein
MNGSVSVILTVSYVYSYSYETFYLLVLPVVVEMLPYYYYGEYLQQGRIQEI